MIKSLVSLIIFLVGIIKILNGCLDLFNPNIREDFEFIKQNGKDMLIEGSFIIFIGVLVGFL